MARDNIRSETSLEGGFQRNYELLREATPHPISVVHLLVSQPRTGSTLVCDYLSKAPDLGWCDEWLNPIFMKVVVERQKLTTFQDVLRWILQRAASPSGKVIINVQAPHITAWQKRGVNLRSLGTKIAHLRRRNLLEQSMSLAKARINNQFYQVSPQNGAPKTVPFEAIAKALTDVLAWEQVSSEFLKARTFKEFFYEEISSDLQLLDQFFEIYDSPVRMEDLPATNLVRQQTAEDLNAIQKFLAYVNLH